MSKKNIILSSGVGILIIIIIFTIVRLNMKRESVSNDDIDQLISITQSEEPTNTDSAKVEIQEEIPVVISWIFEGYIVEEHTSNEVTSNIISLKVNDQVFKLGTYPGKSEEIKDFATYDMPSDTLAACKSILQTGGDYFYVVRKDNTSLSVMVRFMDDAIIKVDNVKTVYTEKTVIQIPLPKTSETTQP